MKRTIRIVSSYFVAGVDIENRLVVHAAPILGYMRGWTETKVIDYIMRKRWTWEDV